MSGFPLSPGRVMIKCSFIWGLLSKALNDLVILLTVPFMEIVEQILFSFESSDHPFGLFLRVSEFGIVFAMPDIGDDFYFPESIFNFHGYSPLMVWDSYIPDLIFLTPEWGRTRL